MLTGHGILTFQGTEYLEIYNLCFGAQDSIWILIHCHIFQGFQSTCPWWWSYLDLSFGVILWHCLLRCGWLSTAYILDLGREILLLFLWVWEWGCSRVITSIVIARELGLVSTFLSYLLLWFCEILEGSASLECTCIFLVKTSFVNRLGAFTCPTFIG